MKEQTKANVKKSLIAVLFNVAAAAVCVAVFGIAYSTDDDFIFAEYIAAGQYNICFSNYFLFRVIAGVQGLIYPLNAYSIAHLFFAVVSFSAITRVLLDRLKVGYALLVSLFLFCLFATVNIYTVSFTTIPALIATAGFLCILHFSKENKSIFMTALGILLVVVGSAYRFQAFIPSAVYTAAFVGVTELILWLDKKEKKLADLVKNVFEIKRLSALLIALAICFSLNYYSESLHNSTPEYKYFAEYTQARSAVWDYQIPKYEECKSEYDAIGIDEDDLKILERGLIDDKGAFTLENLKAIREISKNYYSGKNTPSGIVKSIFLTEAKNIAMMNYRGLLIVVSLLLFLAFLLTQKKKQALLLACFGVLIAAFYAYLFYIGRAPFRAIYSVWFSPIIYLLYSLDSERLKSSVLSIAKKRKLIITAACMLTSLIILASAYTVSYTDNEMTFNLRRCSNHRQPLAEYVMSNPNDSYELCMSSDLYEGNYKFKNALHINRIDENQNYKLFNCTYYRHPFDDECIKAILNTDNMFSNLVNENVYYVECVTKSPSITEPLKHYLEKYYFKGKTVGCRLVTTQGEHDIYKFYIED